MKQYLESVLNEIKKSKDNSANACVADTTDS